MEERNGMERDKEEVERGRARNEACHLRLTVNFNGLDSGANQFSTIKSAVSKVFY